MGRMTHPVLRQINEPLGAGVDGLNDPLGPLAH
jgi:hypothetical protein